MNVLKIILLIAISMAFSITLAMKTISKIEEAKIISPNINTNKVLTNFIKPSRFLAEKKKEKSRKHHPAGDNCKKNKHFCLLEDDSGDFYNSTCCKNKCVDLQYDDDNCGACNKRCDYTEACCRGQCVYLAFDKRHCGECNNRCTDGLFCIYGMCDYA
ncbi:stigma-specific STIG1-like protein 3 [Impatiens glandulifera]|uniref:stigma-specific STIG1-like protein 3 n=1 Tax=Impatiens glandulifera TaxID=253017 RepID=UPI001FB0C98B|nr:stigma-specific STIG1-like protein 3 [Impatiens glandulifera]